MKKICAVALLLGLSACSYIPFIGKKEAPAPVVDPATDLRYPPDYGQKAQ